MSSINAAASSGTSINAPARIPQYSWIRVIACFAIVLLHTLDNSLSYFSDTVTPGQVTIVRTASTLLMWAVPCFLMVTGALLLDNSRPMPLSKVLGKYVKRMAVALVIFTFIFTVIKYFAGERDDIIVNFLRDLLQCSSMSYLWYLYLMIGLYLMMPLYRLVTKAADESGSDRIIKYLVILLIVFTSVLPLLEYADLEVAFYIPTDVIYPAYLFIGYLLSRHNMSAGKAAALLVVCGGAAAVLMANLAGTDIDMDGLTGYASPLTIGMSAGIFSLMLRIRAAAGEILSSVDRCTFGIYLIHMIGVRLVMKDFGIDPYAFGPFGFAGMTIVFFIASYGITWCIKKIPALDFL